MAAKRSDFAQKLLDDLRVRKEKMAPSQSSNRSNSMAIDVYAYSKQTYRGRSGDMRTNGTVGSRNGNLQNSYRGSSRTPIVQDASNQIVAYGSDRSSGQMGNLSMALAFALENGGKLGRTDSSSRNSMLGFLNQFGRGAINFSQMERKGSVNSFRGATNLFPNLSHLHVEEISRGAQKLNQILRACSNGLNVDGFSIEIGKELMKGALDLEESLRMLVNLQEASEYMVSSQRKNQITLLDDDDEDEEDNAVKIAEQKQLDLPRFSFDKSSRHARKIQEVGRDGFKQKLTAALTYSTEGSSFNHEKQGNKITSTSVSHRKSVSYSSGVKNPSTYSHQKESKPEKERIPNVIAKLMGLNELPKNENLKDTTQKDSSSKPKRESRVIGQTIQESSKISGVKTKDIENLASTNRQKVVEGNKYPLMQNTAFVLQAEKNMLAKNVSLEVVVHDGKQTWKDLEGLKPEKGPGRTTIKTDKQQKNPQTIKPDKPVARNSFEAELVMQGKTGFKEIRLQMEKQNGNKVLPSNQHKQSESPDEKQRGEVKEQQSAQQKLQARKQRGSEVISKSTSKGEVVQKRQSHTDQAKLNKKSKRDAGSAVQSKGISNGTYHENLVKSKSSADLNFDTKDFPPNYPDPEPAKEKFGTPAVKEERPVHVAPLQKARSRRVNKSEIPRRIDEVATRRNGTLNNLQRPLKHQSSISQEVARRSPEKLGVHNVAEKVRASRSKQAEPRIIKSNKSTARIEPLDLAQNQQKKAEEASILYDPNEVESRGSLEEPQTLLRNESCQNYSVSIVTNDQQDQAHIFGDDEFITGPNTLPHVAGTHDYHDSLENISYAEQLEHRKTFNWRRKQEPMTESENQLKQIVIKSQLFLNTAEALFELDIPFGILHESGYEYCTLDEDSSKLALDCGYEVMKRKGTRQELSVLHPNCVKTKISIRFIKLQSLDELVKQLDKEFEKLKLYGRNGKMECELAEEEYVPRMLESDVHNLEPEVNSMWDMGWDETMFAILEVDQVIRDLEIFVLSGLVDELTRDLFIH